MRIRGTQETVKPIEVNVDTVYVRTNIVRIEEEDIDAMKGFSGWEYNEQVFNKSDYISKLAFNEDAEGIALLLSLMMAEIDTLRTELFNLKGDE